MQTLTQVGFAMLYSYQTLLPRLMSYLKVIAGPMFSGKTEELIRILRRCQIAGKKILVLKPLLDTRTSEEIASRHKPNPGWRDFKNSLLSRPFL